MKHALSPKTIFSRIIIYSFLILLAFFFLAPVYAMVVSSLKPFAEVSVFTMWELPKSLHLSNFTEAFETLKPLWQQHLSGHPGHDSFSVYRIH